MPKNRSARLVFALVVVALLGLISRNMYRRYMSGRLIAAVETRNVAAVRSLLARGADPNSHKTESAEYRGMERSALYLASEVFPAPSPEQEAIACLLIQHGADLSAGRGGDRLQSACMKGSVAIERCLLEHGVAPDAANVFHQSPIDAAIDYSLPRPPRSFSPLTEAMQAQQRSVGMEMIRLLREHGARLNLWQAARLNDVDALRAFLDAGTPVDTRERKSGYISTDAEPTALALAVQKGNLNSVRLLLERGANINAEYDGYSTPLADAIRGGHLEMVRLLLQHQTHVNPQTSTSDIAIVQACSTLPQLVPELLRRGADLKTCGDQALNAALQNNHPELVALLLPSLARQGGKVGHSVLLAALKYHPALVPVLLAQGADARETPRENNSLLWHALHYGRNNLLMPLLRAGANVNARAYDIAPLVEALGKGTDMVNLLLTNGADPNWANRFGQSPLVTAAQVGDVEVVRALLKHGAAVNGKGGVQHTPLYYARRHSHAEMAALLLLAGGHE